MLQSKACLLKLHSICAVMDWGSNQKTQPERARRAVECLGAELHPKQVTMQVLDGYVANRKSQGRGNSTIKAELSALKVMLTRAIRLGWLDALPLFPENRTLPLPEPRELVIPDFWYEDLLLQLEWAEHRVEKDIVVFCRRLGCRIDEALSLEWDRVDLKERKVQFVKTKGLRARRLPINDEVFALLKALKKRETASVFDKPYTTFYSRYKAAIKRTCNKLKLGSDVEDQWVTHTLRHTRITELANNGASAPQIQGWAGHQSLSTSQKYIHASGVNLTHLADC
jgi:integrase